MATKLAKIIADYTSSLAVEIAVGGTTGSLISAVDDDGVALPNGQYYFTIDGANSLKEHIQCTLTGTSLSNIMSCSRQGVLTAGMVRKHRVGAPVSITDFAHIKMINNLLDGTDGFDAATKIGYATDPGLISTDTEKFATVRYVNNIAIAGAPDASTTVKGLAKASVAPVSATSPIFVGDNDTRVPTIAQTAALVGNNVDIAIGAGNKVVTQTGLQHNAEKYAADTSGSSTAYVVTLSPAPTSLTAGMVVFVKFGSANTTTTPTLNINGLGAKTIVKLTSTALVAGDIAAGQVYPLIYDGTNLVLLAPVGQVAATSYVSAQLAGTSTTTQNVDSVQTTNFTPKTITLYYLINGVTGGSNKYSAGIAVYNSSGTLLVNQSYFIDAAAASGTGAFALGVTTTPPVSGSVSGSYNVVTLSIPSVTAAGFTVRAAYNQTGGTLGAVTSLIAIATA